MYIAKTDIEKYLGITLNTNGQNLVDSLIPAVDKLIDNYCGRSWSNDSSSDITERFDGGTDIFFLKNPPIASVSSVKIAKSAGYNGEELDPAMDEYYIYDTHVQLADVAVDLPRSVEITYRTSANALPADIKQAEIQWVAELFKAAGDAGKIAKDVSIGSMRMSFQTSGDDMPDFVKRVLNMYRLISL